MKKRKVVETEIKNEIENGIDFSIFDNDLTEEEIKEIKEKQKIAGKEILKEREREKEEKEKERSRKISEALTGKHPSEETRKKLSDAFKGEKNPNYGKPMSEEQKKKISETKKGTGMGEKNPFYGKHHSEEALKKLSESQKGEKNHNYGKHLTETHKLNISAGRKGILHSEESRKKMSETRKGGKSAFYGKIHSEESIKKMSDAKEGKYIGEKNPNWQGGVSFLPYCQKFNNKLKRAIRNRDNNTCQLCYCKENGEKHSVHHIHYDKENCYPDLITLCRRCHLKSNNNRDYYEKLFMNKLNDRGLLYWTKQISGC